MPPVVEESGYIYKENENSISYFIGVSLATASSIFIGSSFILKKISLSRLSKTNSLRAAAGGFGYLKDLIWWAGFLSMGFGELLNLIAYGFAPASVVTPLGALSVLVSAVLASRYLQEHLTVYGKVGCTLCIIGSLLIIFNAPRGVDLDTVSIAESFQKGPVTWYILLTISMSIFLIVFIAPKYGSRYVSIYIIICSQTGSFTVIACKILAVTIKNKIQKNVDDYHIMLTSFISLVVCVCIQITYLNKALDVFGTSYVTPIYYVTFTTLVLLFSGILFDEWQQMTLVNSFGTALGLTVAFIAIYLLHAKKDKTRGEMLKDSDTSRYT